MNMRRRIKISTFNFRFLDPDVLNNSEHDTFDRSAHIFKLSKILEHTPATETFLVVRVCLVKLTLPFQDF